MTTKFHTLIPMLRTKDLQATIDFYVKRLGFQCDSLSEKDGWAHLSRDSVKLMVSVANSHMPFAGPAFTGSLYFNVEDAAAIWPALKDVAKIAYPLEDFPYGMREFAIYDNNGYMLQFGSPLGS